MIINSIDDVTKAVVEEAGRIVDPRSRELIGALIRHLHAFVREVKLTEKEFQKATAQLNAIGQKTTGSHNEAVLMAGSLGVSALVCLLNNGDAGERQTTANLLGPFWRLDSPPTANGETIVRSPTPGEPLFVDVRFEDPEGEPVQGAQVDVWHCNGLGLYENQDSAQADMNLRGTFVTDETGRISFRSIKPVGYPIPVDGPTGDLIRLQRRHNLRPAHVHFLAQKPGYKTLISQVYDENDPNIDTDVQFGVTTRLLGDFTEHTGDPALSGDLSGRWHSLGATLVIEPGESTLPKPPITDKASSPAPVSERLVRT